MTLTLSPQITNESLRKPDRVAGALAGGFVVLLLATELILTLPDEADSPVFVATFLRGPSELHHHLAGARAGGRCTPRSVRVAAADQSIGWWRRLA
jgi:hypothetical protein